MDKISLIRLNIHFIRYGNNDAVALGCLNPDKRAQCLREKSVHEILNVPSPPDRPSVDSSRTSPYLLHNPLDLSTSREYLTDIDVMLGFTEDDGMLITQFLLAYPTLYNVLKSLWSFLGPYLLFQQTQIIHTSEEDIAVTNDRALFARFARSNLNFQEPGNGDTKLSGKGRGEDTCYMSHVIQARLET